MRDNLTNQTTANQTFEVTLDGQIIEMPPAINTLSAIRAYWERIALERQRVLMSIRVDGFSAAKARRTGENGSSFRHVDAETSELTGRASQILGTVLEQIEDARKVTESAITNVLINEGPVAREIWWELVPKLKQPLMVLSMMPEETGWQIEGCASLRQTRKWQLEQLGVILKSVDEACWLPETMALSNALENRVLPWLRGLEYVTQLWYQTMLAGDRIAAA